jgi:hypothetical protein
MDKKSRSAVLVNEHGDASREIQFDWSSAKRRPKSFTISLSSLGVSTLDLEEQIAAFGKNDMELPDKTLPQIPCTSTDDHSKKDDGKLPLMLLRRKHEDVDDVFDGLPSLLKRSSTQSSEPSSSRTASGTLGSNISSERGLLSMIHKKSPSVYSDSSSRSGTERTLMRASSHGDLAFRSTLGSNNSIRFATESMLKRVVSVSDLSFRLEFLDVEPRNVAAQLDLIEFEIFSQIKVCWLWLIRI